MMPAIAYKANVGANYERSAPGLYSLILPAARMNPHSTLWIYPLLASDGNTIVVFEIKGGLYFTVNFLCPLGL